MVGRGIDGVPGVNNDSSILRACMNRGTVTVFVKYIMRVCVREADIGF